MTDDDACDAHRDYRDTMREHGNVTVNPNARELIEKYGMYGRTCRVCGKITGLPESDVCFDHREAP